MTAQASQHTRQKEAGAHTVVHCRDETGRVSGAGSRLRERRPSDEGLGSEETGRREWPAWAWWARPKGLQHAGGQQAAVGRSGEKRQTVST